MVLDPSDPALHAFLALHEALPRQGPGSDETTRRLLALAGPLPSHPRALDLGCGPGRASLVLAADAGAHVTALDLHRPFLDELDAAAARRGLAAQIRTVLASMAEPPFPDRSFDLVWAEGSVYNVGFDAALRCWRRLLAPGGVLVVTECEWATAAPSSEVASFWADAYPLRTTEQNVAAAREAGYEVAAVHPLPERDWWDEYYTPILDRLATADPTIPGMPAAIAAERAEIALRREHGRDYRYAGYVLRAG